MDDECNCPICERAKREDLLPPVGGLNIAFIITMIVVMIGLVVFYR